MDLVEENCGIYSIWSFCPMKRWQAIRDYFRDKPLCLTPWFPLVYWVVLSISIWGTVSIRICVCMYVDVHTYIYM